MAAYWGTCVLTVIAGLFLDAKPAKAGIAGRELGVSAPHITARYFTLRANTPYTIETDGRQYWSSPVPIGPGAGDPAAITDNDKVRVFVRNPNSSALIGYVFSSSNGWSGATPQLWANNTPVTVSQGIGVTVGSFVDFDNNATQRIIALVPLASPSGQVELATWDSTLNRWTVFDDTVWPNGKPITNARPSIAYVPFSSNNYNEGRYYLAWRKPGDNHKHVYNITFTEGNNHANNAGGKRFVVNGPVNPIMNVWQLGDGSISLLYRHEFDDNLRAAWTFNAPTAKIPTFSRIADHVLDGVLKDQDDFGVIRANLRCSIKTESCPL